MPEIVSGVRWTAADIDLFQRALQGHDAALGEDDQGRQIVRRWRHRLTQTAKVEADEWEPVGGETFYEADLTEVLQVFSRLLMLWRPQTETRWWIEQGAASQPTDAIEDLALERRLAIERLSAAHAPVMRARLMLSRAKEEADVRAGA